MHTSGRSYFESIRYIKDKEQNIDISTEISKKLITVTDYMQFDELTIKRLYNNLLISERPKDYLKYRKITQSSCAKFSLGYSEKQDMVTIPVHSPDGIPVGFVGRSVEGKEFKNTPGLPKSKVLFNLHRVKQSNKVYVVESSFDAIRLDQVGLPCVATLGANVSNTQIDLLKKYFNNIIIVADNDEAGSNMKNRIMDRIKSNVSVVKLDDRYKDIGDMDDESILKLEVSFDEDIASMLK